jgi:hypothetical protein
MVNSQARYHGMQDAVQELLREGTSTCWWLLGYDDDEFIPKISEEGKAYKETTVDDQGKQNYF